MVRTLTADKRERFLASALRLFAENGVQNTSTADIARAAGTAAGTLFLYFPTRQDLIDALVLQISRDQAQAVRALLEPTQTVRETFWNIWEGSLRWFLDHPDAYAYVQQVRDTGIVSEAAVRESGQNLTYFAETVQRGLSEKAIQHYPPELTGGLLYQSIVAVMNLLRAEPDPARQSQYIRQGFAIFWDGIKKENP